MRAWPLLLLSLATACREPPLDAAEGVLRLEPSDVDLGQVVAGLEVDAVFEVHNDGPGPLTLEWQAADGPFALVEPPSSLAGGASARLIARVRPLTPGPVEAEFAASTGRKSSTATIHATAIAPHVCVPTAQCLVSVWSEPDRRCIEAPAPDADACDPGSACLEAATCHAGRCIGREVSCDDHDLCTTDVCNEKTGCQHDPAPSCPGDGLCHVGVCDPTRGCQLVPALDGTVCGRMGCSGADVCMAGECVERVPPDGFICADASPCQAEGRCVAQVCQRAPPATLPTSWVFGAPQPDGGPAETWADVLIAPSGELTLSSYFMSAPRLHAQSAQPVDLTAVARRCMYWSELLVCADYPGTHQVSALDPVTGDIRWTYSNILLDLPLLSLNSQDTFLARLAVLSSTQLAATFETRTVDGTGVDLLCRTFSVVVLDRQGASLTAWTLEDPLFQRCVHPHSFGVATDTSGNLYYAFTPSLQSNPASPALRETLLMSYSPTGVLRWKRYEPTLAGGELAVARGVLMHSNSADVWDADAGTVLATLPSAFGVGVATRDALILGPVKGGATLPAVTSSSLVHLWDYTLSPPRTFASDQLRLATWASPRGPRTVALSYTTDRSALELLAVDAVTGLELFSCPVDLPSAPLAGEVGDGGVAIMVAGPVPPACEHCDPRFAWTRNRFLWLPLPGVSGAVAPWPGTHGGPGHDHQEDQVP